MAAVGGFEYTFYGIGGTAADVGALVEYLYDGRSEDAPPTLWENDLFTGLRLALNDAADTSILAGVSVDVETRETFVNIEAERRLFDDVVGTLRLRAFTGSGPRDAGYAFARDDYLELRLRWYY